MEELLPHGTYPRLAPSFILRRNGPISRHDPMHTRIRSLGKGNSSKLLRMVLGSVPRMNIRCMHKRLLHVKVIVHAPRVEHATSASTFCLTLGALTALTSLPCETTSPLFRPFRRKQLAVVIATAGFAPPRQPRADILGREAMGKTIHFP